MLFNCNVENFWIWYLVKIWIFCWFLRLGLLNFVSWWIRGFEWKGYCELYLIYIL